MRKKLDFNPNMTIYIRKEPIGASVDACLNRVDASLASEVGKPLARKIEAFTGFQLLITYLISLGKILKTWVFCKEDYKRGDWEEKREGKDK